MNLSKITVTGADNKTQIPDILRYLGLYPKLEFGILVHAPWSNGSGRFPSFAWIESLARWIDDDDRDRFAMHLCGSYVAEFFHHKRFVEG